MSDAAASAPGAAPAVTLPGAAGTRRHGGRRWDPLLGHLLRLPEVSFTPGSSTVPPRKPVAKEMREAAGELLAQQLLSGSSPTPLIARSAAIVGMESIPHQPASHGATWAAGGSEEQSWLQESRRHHLSVPQGEPPGFWTPGCGSSMSRSWGWSSAGTPGVEHGTKAELHQPHLQLGSGRQHSSTGEPRQI